MQKPISKMRRRARPTKHEAVPPSLSYEDWLIGRLKDPQEAAAYLEGVIEDGYQPAIMLALRQVAKAYNSPFYFTSAKTGENVVNAFQQLANLAVQGRFSTQTVAPEA